jgi:hypothetical protein
MAECDPINPPVPSPSVTPEPPYLARCIDSINGLTGISDGSFENTVEGNGFLIDAYIRKDSDLIDALYLKWPSKIDGNFYENVTGGNCGFRPTLVVKRGQWIVFRQQDESNTVPIYIATSNQGSAGEFAYTLTGGEAEYIAYREGTVTLTGTGEYTSGPLSDPNDRCPNLAFRVPKCSPDVLYYRLLSADMNEAGGIILVSGSVSEEFNCPDTTDGCDPHPRPWTTPLVPLSLGDTFYEWYQATNSIISALDPLKIYDIRVLGGLQELIPTTGGVMFLEARVGDGLRIYTTTMSKRKDCTGYLWTARSWCNRHT